VRRQGELLLAQKGAQGEWLFHFFRFVYLFFLCATAGAVLVDIGLPRVCRKSLLRAEISTDH
jgi:hypothetical protein